MRLVPAFVWMVLLSCANAAIITVSDSASLQTALTNTSLNPAAGTTNFIELAAGTYRGNFKSTIGPGPSNSRIIVRPAVASVPPNVTITDGSFGDLRTTMNTAGTQNIAVVIAGSDLWQIGQVVIMEARSANAELLSLNDRTSPTNWIVTRGWGATLTNAHAVGSVALVRAPLIDSTGSNVTFFGMEFVSALATNRVIAPSGTNSWWVSQALNLDVGTGCSAINNWIHSVGHPAIGYWTQGTTEGAELYGNIITGGGFYDWNGALWTRGNGTYMQNAVGRALVGNNISFANFNEGLDGNAVTGPLTGFEFDRNICFRSPNDAPLKCGAETMPMTNNSITTNVIMGSLHTGYTSPSNRLQNVIGNTVVMGSIDAKQYISGIWTNNTVFVPTNVTVANSGQVAFEGAPSANPSGMTWDRNTYRYQNNSRLNRFSFNSKQFPYPPGGFAADGAGNLLFDNDGTNSWKAWSGFDSNTTYTSYWPTSTVVTITANSYDSNRWHVSVVNTSGTDNPTNTAYLDLSTIGFSSGQIYQVIDVQNFPAVAATGTYSSGTVALPLTLTNVASISGTLTHYTNEHTNVQYPGLFNAFVVIRSSVLGTVAQTGPGQSRSRGRR